MIPYFYIHKHLYPTLYNPIIVYKLASVAIEILFSVRFETQVLKPYTSSILSSPSSARKEKQSLVVGSYKYSILVVSL